VFQAVDSVLQDIEHISVAAVAENKYSTETLTGRVQKPHAVFVRVKIIFRSEKCG